MRVFKSSWIIKSLLHVRLKEKTKSPNCNYQHFSMSSHFNWPKTGSRYRKLFSSKIKSDSKMVLWEQQRTSLPLKNSLRRVKPNKNTVSEIIADGGALLWSCNSTKEEKVSKILEVFIDECK